MRLFIHIPKTSGTSIREALSRRYGKSIAFDYGPHNQLTSPILRDEQLSAQQKRQTLADQGMAVIYGHFPYWSWDGAFEASEVITSIRHPVDRCISHYQHLLTKGGAGGSESIVRLIQSGELPLAKFAEHPYIANLQARWLSITEEGMDDLRHFSAVLVSDQSEGAPKIPQRLNVGWRTFRVEPSDIRRIIQANALDMLLYEMVRQAWKEKYWSWDDVLANTRRKRLFFR